MLALALLLLCEAPAGAGEGLAILPPRIVLDGPHAAQGLVVEARGADGAFVADSTTEAKFRVANPNLASVGDDGVLRPRSDGETLVYATIGDATVSVPVTIKGIGSDEPRNFSRDVLPVLTKAGCNQGACHGAAAGKGGLRLTLRGYGPETDFDALTRQARARRIDRTHPERSLLLLKPTGVLEHGGGIRFAPGSADYAILAGWIAAGTPAPREEDPRIESLEVHPSAVRLAPGQNQKIVVLAHYSDGRTADVTRWSKFSSVDDNVATVDDATGIATVRGHGEGGIAVWYASLVQRMGIAAPYPDPIPAEVYANAPRRNQIDEFNLAKLKSLNLAPSGDCGDATFLRRAYLDATGTLPPVEVVDAFLADADPDKRAKLVDRILESPEYVDYWTYQWCDLLLVSTQKLPSNAMWSFYDFVRRSVAENRGWDKLAREVVTATGSTVANGAANFFALHRDPIDLTETASMAFLGMPLTCARCHNHPMEKWTQDQYYGMASLFSRVRLKDGDQAGEVIVTAAPEGEIRHPRTGKVMLPEPLDGKAMASEDRRDRREAFADWLVEPSNPYFTHAIVNRVWARIFGRGLVDPEDDLRATNPPADPALMDWLVEDFRAHGYDVKRLIRMILTSGVYARSGAPEAGTPPEAAKLLAFYPPRRLAAEVLLDATARVAAVPTPFEGYPAGWRSMQLPDVKVGNAFLEAFGRPQRVSTCSCERSDEPSVAQALHLANGDTLNKKLAADGSAAAKAAKDGLGDDAILDGLFKAALSRPPSDAERARLKPILAVPAEERRQAIEDLYWAVLTSKEFLFNH
jgi:hypothetical protein